MTGDKFRDRGVERVLYEQSMGGNVELMLRRGPQNSRVNENMARWIMAVRGITMNWRGKYQDLLGPVFDDLQDLYMDMEGYSRKQAIELSAAEARGMGGGVEEIQKPGGLMGLLKGK